MYTIYALYDGWYIDEYNSDLDDIFDDNDDDDDFGFDDECISFYESSDNYDETDMLLKTYTVRSIASTVSSTNSSNSTTNGSVSTNTTTSSIC